MLLKCPMHIHDERIRTKTAVSIPQEFNVMIVVLVYIYTPK